MSRIGLSLTIGFGTSFFLLFLGFSGREFVWTMQIPGFWVGAAFALGVHGGGLYLVAALVNSVLYGALYAVVLSLLKRLMEKRERPKQEQARGPDEDNKK